MKKLISAAHAGLKAGIAAGTKTFSTLFYEGARRYSRDRTFIPWVARDTQVQMSPFARTEMTDISRFLYANLGVYRGACNTLARYALLTKPQSQSKDKVWAQEAEAAWEEAQKLLDVTGRLDWVGIQRLTNIAIDRDGDVAWLLVRTGEGEWPQIQIIGAHQIGDGGRNDTVDGVKLSDAGRPTAFRVLLKGGGWKDISANDIIHIFEPERADQTRGLCAWQAGLNHSRDIKDIIGFLKVAIKRESAIAVLKKTTGGISTTEDWSTEGQASLTSDGKVLEQVFGGLVERFDVSEDIKSFATDRPSPNVEKFVEFLIRDFCIGNGLPFEFVWNPTNLSGPSQRFIIAQAQRRIAERQQLMSRHANRLWAWWAAVMAKRNDLGPLPADFWRVRWQTPPELTIDVGREAAQDRADVQAGIQTLTQLLAKYGIDFDDHLAERVEEAKKIVEAAKAAGVPAWMLYMATANGNPKE